MHIAVATVHRMAYLLTWNFRHIDNFIAAGASPRDVVAFQPSAAAKVRVVDLIYQEKTAGLSPEEAAELDHYLQLEHMMRLV